MVLQFESILAKLQEIPDVDVIDSSDEADEAGHSLPAIVLDFEGGALTSLTERGDDFTISPEFSLVIYTPKNPKDRAASRKESRSLFSTVLKKLLEVYPNGFNITQASIFTAASFAGGECYAFGFMIVLNEEVFTYE